MPLLQEAEGKLAGLEEQIRVLEADGSGTKDIGRAMVYGVRYMRRALGKDWRCYEDVQGKGWVVVERRERKVADR